MDESTVRIRNATPDDLAIIVRFNLSLAEDTEGLRLDRRTVSCGVDAVLRDPAKGRYFLAELDGRVVGQLMTTFEWSDWRNGSFLWIQSVWVENDARRRGVFRALLAHVQHVAESPAYCGLRLYVHGENAVARETYLRLGLVAPGYEVLETPDSLRTHGS